MKKLLLLLTVAFLLTLIPPAQAAENDFGCCANIEFLDAVCEESAITQIECCPATSPQYGLPQHPADQAECLADFFTTDACEELPACDLGCCFDPAAVSQCAINNIESLCLVNSGAEFAKFTTGTPRGGNLCYAEESDGSITKKFPQCPDIGTDTQSCADFSGDEAACTSSICSFCKSTGACLPDCSTCPQSEDQNQDGVCEGAPTQLRCEDISGENTCLASGCSFCQSSQQCLQTCTACQDNQRDGDNDNICDNIVQTQFCSELTDEQSCSSSLAGCYFCPNPSQGSTVCRPQAQACLQCDENQDANNDRVCDNQGLSQCSDGIDNDGDGSIDTSDLCCLNPSDTTENNECSCPAGNSCDSYGNQQCFDGGGIPINNNLFSGTTGQVCCSTACFMPACQVGQPTASFDSSTVTTGRSTTYTESFCSCGNTIVDTDSPNDDQLFCCQLPGFDSFLQGSPCSELTFTGKVVNANTQESIQATLRFVNKALGLSFPAETNTLDITTGDPIFKYRRAVSTGITYTLEVEASTPGFAKFKESGIVVPNTPGITIEKDIELTPLDGNCKTEFPTLTLTSIDHLQCSPQLTVNWDSFGCPITKYVLFRSEGSGKGDRLAELGPSTTSYIDTSSEFDKTFSYTLEANLADTALNGGSPISSSPLSTFAGDAVCELQCNKGDFCLRDTNDKKIIVGSCDTNNKLTENNCETSLAPGAVCIDNGENDEAACIGTTVCKNIDVAFPNILGMYYKENSCNGGDGTLLDRNFCYYDIEDADGHDTQPNQPFSLNPLPTTVDRCISCSPSMTCFDYKSEGACEKDNCGLGGPTNCQWEENIGLNSELGRGICFSASDKSTDDCDECQGLDQCTDNTCLKLGACFANEEASACNACASPSATESAPTLCEDYQTETACQGASPFIVPGDDLSSKTFIPSQDKCQLGVCEWTGTACIKDGDDDGIQDCVGTGLLPCRRDTVAPVTKLLHPAFFSAGSENVLAFEIEDISYGNVESITLFMCTTTEESCTPDPNQGIIVQKENNKFEFSTILTPPEGQEGDFTISYFAQDIYRNVEPIKTKKALIDTISPIITISPIEVTNNLEDSSTSDIASTITSSEFVVCNINVEKITSTIEDLPGFPLNGVTITPGTPFSLDNQDLEELADGVYRIALTCTDNALNPVSFSRSVEIDQNKQINTITPFDQIVTTSPTVIQITTLNDQFGKAPYDCKFRLGTSQEASFQQIINPNAEPGTDYIYRSTIPLTDGFHTVDTICRDNGAVVDTATAIFSVDTTPPEVTPLVEVLGGFTPLDVDDVYLGNTILSFACDDDTGNFNNLGPLGCLTTDVKFCFGTATQGCFIDANNQEQNFAPGDVTKLPRLEESGFMCFAGSDGTNNNYENPECIFVNVDNNIPQLIDLSIDGVPHNIDTVNPFVTTQNSIRVSGTWIEPSGRVKVKLDNREGIFVDTAGRGIWTFAPVILQSNSIQSFSLTATDLSAINGKNSISPPLSFQIANDQLGPIIADPQVVNQDEERIEVLSQANIDTAGSGEYKESIRLVATISDPKFTNTIIPTSTTVRIENIDTALSTTGCAVTREIPLKKITGNVFSAQVADCLEVGNYRARFAAKDGLQNPSTKEAFFTISDTIPAEINISVHDGIDAVTLIHPGGGVKQYTVKINTSEPMSSIQAFALTFLDVTGITRTVPLQTTQTDSNKQRFTATLTIPGTGFFTNLDKATATFTISSKDQNNVDSNVIANGRAIVIDTIGPKIPPTFFTLTDQLQFTNIPSFFVSGVDFEQKPDVGIQLRQALGTSIDEFISAKVIPLRTTTPPSYFKPFMDDDGQNLRGEEILLSLKTDIFTIRDPFNTFDRPSSSISPDRFMTFTQPRRFSGKNYEIVGVQVLSNAIKRVTISPPFEDDPTLQGLPIFVMNTAEPPGFFGTTVTLEDGVNAFFAASEDELGNLGRFSDPHIIVLEQNPPFFFNEIPRDKSIISENNSIIVVEVQNKSPIVSTFMDIDGVVVIPNQQPTQSGVLLIHNINVQEGLPEGVYNIKVNATDEANNFNEFDWSFTIDVDVPSTPTISPKGFIRSPNPELLIEFTTGEIINLTSVTLTGTNLALDLLPFTSSLAPHVFTASTPSTLPDGSYTVAITAAKIISNVGGVISQSLEGVFPEHTFVIDATPPKINLSSSPAISQDTIILEVNISEDNLVSAEVTGIDITNTTPIPFTLTPERRSGTLVASIPLGILASSEGERQIEVKAIDQAKNSITQTTSVFVDLTPPSAQIIIQAPPLIADKFTNEDIFQLSCSCTDQDAGCTQNQRILSSVNSQGFLEINSQPINLASQIGNKNTNITFRCEVQDQAGNLGITDKNITVIKEGPQIEIIQPEFGGTSTQLTTIQIQTSQPSVCTLHQFREGNSIGSFSPQNAAKTLHQVIYNLGDAFDNTVKTVEYFVKCTNDYDQEKVTRNDLLIDSRPLIIEASSLGKGTIVTDTTTNTINIQTNLDSICRFSTLQEPSPPTIPFSSLEFSSGETFSRVHSIDHDFGFNGVFHIYIDCVDKTSKTASSGQGFVLQNQIDVDFPIEIADAGIITQNNKITLKQSNVFTTADTLPTLFAKTNKKSFINGVESCQFSLSALNRQSSTTVQQSLEGNRLFNIYKLPLSTPLSEGIDTIDVECRSGINKATFTVSVNVDTTPPPTPTLNTLPATANSQLSVTGFADAEFVRILVNQNPAAITKVDAGTFSTTLSLEPYTHNQQITITADAFDILENGPSTATSTQTITVDKESDTPTAINVQVDEEDVIITGQSEPQSIVRIYIAQPGLPPVLLTTANTQSNGKFNQELEGMPEGHYTLFVTTVDFLANLESLPSISKSFTIDLSPPRIIAITPNVNEQFSQGSIPIHIILEDDSDIDVSSIEIRVDGSLQSTQTGKTPTISGIRTNTVALLTETDGVHTLSVSAVDSLGQEITTSRTFTIESDAPTLISTSLNSIPLETFTVVNDSTQKLDLLFNERIDAINSELDTIQIPSSSITTEDNRIFSIQLPPLADQVSHTITIEATTSLGTTRRTFIFGVDTLSPIFDTTSITPKSQYTEIRGIASDAFPASISVDKFLSHTQVDKGRFTATTTSLNPTLTMQDQAGHSEQFTLELPEPSEDIELTVNTVPTASSLPITITGTTSPRTEVTITINNQVNSVTSDVRGEFTLNAGPAQGMQSNQNNLITVSAGEVTKRFTTLVDSSAPRVILTSPEEGDTVSTSEIEIGFEDLSDLNPGASSVKVNGLPVQFTTDKGAQTIKALIDTTPRSISVETLLTDIHGLSSTHSFSFTQADVPEINLLEDLSAYVFTKQPFITASIPEGEQVSATLTSGTGPIPLITIIPPTGDTFVFYPEIALDHATTYTLQISATKETIKKATRTKTFTTDLIPPSLQTTQIQSPTNTNTIDVLGTFVEDNPKSVTFALRTSSGAISSQGTLPIIDNTYLLQTPLSGGDQTFTLTVSITDKSGQVTTETIPIVRNTNSPSIEIKQPQAQAILSQRISNVIVESDTDTKGSILIDNVPTAAQDLLGTIESTIPISFIQEGQTTLEASATDTATNTNTVSNIVTLDTTPPSVSLVTPQLLTNSLTPTISFTLTDSSGVANVTLIIDDTFLVTRLLNGQKSIDVSQVLTTPLSDNTLHTITLVIQDLPGNTHATHHTFFVDTSTPTFLSSAPIHLEQIPTALPTITFEYAEEVTITKAELNRNPIIFTTTNNRIFSHTTTLLDKVQEGTNALDLIVERTTGSSPDVRTLNFIVDTTNPKVEIIGLDETATDTTNTELVTLLVSFSDEHMARLLVTGGKDPVSVPIPDGNGIESNNGLRIPINLTEGQNTILVTAFDGARNTNVSTQVFTRDTVGADITSASVTPALQELLQFRTNSKVVNISGTYSENPIQKITLGSTDATINDIIRTFTLSNININEQRGQEVTNNLLLEILDNAGNLNNFSVIVISDTKGPTIEMTSQLTNASIQRRPTFTLRTDEAATECTLSYIPGQTPSTERMSSTSQTEFSHTPDFQLNLGSNPITIECKDALGNVGEQKLINMFIERAAPDDIPIITDIRPVDGIFLEEDHFLVFKVDQQDIATITLDIKASDNSGGVRCRFGDSPLTLNQKTLGFDDLNFSQKLLTESFTSGVGIISKSVQCEDKAGKLSEIKDIKLTINPNFPVVIQQIAPNTFFRNNSDNDFAELLEVTTYSLDTECKADFIGGGVQQQVMSSTQELGEFRHRISTIDTDSGLLIDGTNYKFEISCEDKGQNLQKGTITIEFKADYITPQPTLDIPSNRTVINSSILMAGSAEENTSIQIFVNGFQSNATTSNGSYAIENVPLSRGPNAVEIRATDLAGNVNSSSHDIFFSSDGPFAEINNPRKNSILGEIRTAQGILTSDVGIDFIASSLHITGPNGVIPSTTTSDAARGLITLTLFTPLRVDGNYTIHLNGVDTQGRSTPVANKFTIDTTTPVIIVTSPTPFANAVVDASPITIEGIITTKAVLQDTISINDQTTSVKLETSGNPNIYSFSFDFLNLFEGDNLINITAINDLGKEGKAEGNIILDSIGPVATITARSIDASPLSELLQDVVLDITGGDLSVVEDSRPLLRLQFNEPVEPTSLKPILIDETTNEPIQVTLFNASLDNKEFNYRPFAKLKESTYTFSINATDLIGNKFNEQEFRFAVFFSDLQFVLTEPSYGFSSVNKLNVTMVTSRSSECSFSTKNVQLANMKKFNTTGRSTHTIRDLFVQTTATLFVKCIDAETDKVEGASFPLTVDLSTPRISNLKATPNPVVEPPERTTLSLTTDDKTICKFDEEFAEFDEMRHIFNGVNAINLQQFEDDFTINATEITSGSLEDLLIVESSFKNDHEVATPFVDLATKLHTFNIRCRNKAELISKLNTSVPVNFDLEIPLQITRINTPPVITTPPPVLNVTTNKGAECFYTNASLPFSGMLRDGLHHTATLPDTDSGAHTFSISCAFSGEETSRSLTFIIDSTAPRITRLSDKIPNASSSNSEVSPFTEKVFVDVEAKDDESAVNEFEIVVKEKFGSVVVLNTTRSAEQSSNGSFFGEFRGFVTGVDLNESKDYRLSVRAKNTADLSSQPKDTDGFSINLLTNSVSCNNNIRDGDETDTDCGGSCRLCSTGRTCDDADDCSSHSCVANICRASSCDDRIENGQETDVDCGGNCNKCDLGEDCHANADCKSTECSNSAGICVETGTCFNRKFDPGTETDIDCGKSCALKCDVNLKCNAEDDCKTRFSCIQGLCSAEEDLDRDGDDVLNNVDNCPDDANNDQQDTDGDKEGDACDLDDDNDSMNDDFEIRHNLDPLDSSDASQDLDEDGLTNLNEFREDTNPRLPDTDDDGYDDKVEIDEGTDPTDPDSHPSSFFTIIMVILILLILGGGGYAAYYYYNKNKGSGPKPLPPKKPMKKMAPIAKPAPKSPTRGTQMLDTLAQQMRARRAQYMKERSKAPSNFFGLPPKSSTPDDGKGWIPIKAPKTHKLSDVFSRLDGLTRWESADKVSPKIKKHIGSDHPTVIDELRKIGRSSTLSASKLSSSLESMAPHTKKTTHTDIIHHAVQSKKISKANAKKSLDRLVKNKIISKQTAARARKKW